MTREEASNILDDYDVNFDGHTAEEIAEAFDVAFRALDQEPKWIPITKRPMTEEEWEHYREWSDVEGAMIFDCELPEDGQEILVSYGGYVCVDTFCRDDGCYFEGVDIDDVDAWMPLPKPYVPDTNIGKMTEIPTGSEPQERSDKE